MQRRDALRRLASAGVVPVLPFGGGINVNVRAAHGPAVSPFVHLSMFTGDGKVHR